MFFMVLLDYSEPQDNLRETRLYRRHLRDRSNPLDLPEEHFLQRYRVSKEMFSYLLREIKLETGHRSTIVPSVLQLAITLQLLGGGAYQWQVGIDYISPMAQCTVSKISDTVIKKMEDVLCHRWIKFKFSGRTQEHFMANYKIPGVIGCIDGTHITFLRPPEHEYMFFNRKGKHSINAMISQVLEKVKPDRIPSTKPDEDRRRRTIIVEKKNGSYGFTLQSYGIHYKKEQEVEMITYVDYVEYDGPAYKAGMREGDVILSINGYDMEKAEHKTLVNFIKNCDNRMRMVVLFEDCCRKVELHLKYIQLQELLKSKMNDLERICLRERELLEGKWKTHSLPARKKATVAADDIDPGSTTDVESASGPSFCRPASSTEDVKKLLRQKTYIVPPPAQFMLAYHCLDSNYRYVIHPSTSTGATSTNAASFNPNCAQSTAKLCKDHQHIIRGSSLDNNSMGGLKSGGVSSYSQQQPKPTSPTKSLHNYDTKSTKSSSRRHLHGHSCNPCMGHFLRGGDKGDKSDKDNTSLDAYDLASPCCDPQCVPSRRKSKHHKDHHHKHKHRDKEAKQGGKDRIPRPKSQPHISPQSQPNYLYRHSKDKHEHHHAKVYDLNASLTSHCSLHSCTSSEFNPAAENSQASYSTSISTDTLYWEPHSESTAASANSSLKKPPNTSSAGTSRPHTHQHHYYVQKYVHPHTGQIQPITMYAGPPVHKPKSWDNLAMKGFGGYGYGYGYMEMGKTSAPPQTRTQTTITIQHRNSIPKKNGFERYSAFVDVENYAPPPTQFLQETTTTTTTITTKSTENLLGPYELSDSCECLEGSSPVSGTGSGSGTNTMEILHDKSGYYSSLGGSGTCGTGNKKQISNLTEIARL